MAGAGAKKRAEDNARTLNRLGLYIAVCSVVHLIVCLLVQSAAWISWAGWIGTLMVHGLCYLSIAAVAKPIYDNRVLIDGGGDLSKGIVSYSFDVVYVTGFVQVLAAFTRYGWYLYLVVPCYAAYMLATKIIMPMMEKQRSQEAEIDEATRKRLAKTERRSERRRVKRI